MIVTEKYMVSIGGQANEFIFQQRPQRNLGVNHTGIWGSNELF